MVVLLSLSLIYPIALVVAALLMFSLLRRAIYRALYRAFAQFRWLWTLIAAFLVDSITLPFVFVYLRPFFDHSQPYRTLGGVWTYLFATPHAAWNPIGLPQAMVSFQWIWTHKPPLFWGIQVGWLLVLILPTVLRRARLGPLPLPHLRRPSTYRGAPPRAAFAGADPLPAAASPSDRYIGAHELGQFVECEQRWALDREHPFKDMSADQIADHATAAQASADPNVRAEGRLAEAYLTTVTPNLEHGEVVHAAAARERLAPAPAGRPAAVWLYALVAVAILAAFFLLAR